jgi:hypothetical protein
MSAFKEGLMTSLLIYYNTVGFAPTTPNFFVVAAKKSEKIPHARNEFRTSTLIVWCRVIRANVDN